ncbi:MAG: signal recognition particle receptor subunit alpha, partial [Solobacterium sp.]|nr:signal recognition particle receptor subunit alpha [Solobacterium sp.]
MTTNILPYTIRELKIILPGHTDLETIFTDALLEADVNFKVVKNFVKDVTEKSLGEEVMTSLTPGQMVIKIVNEELTELLVSETTELSLKSGNEISVIMMMGLQGAGKTTTATK